MGGEPTTEIASKGPAVGVSAGPDVSGGKTPIPPAFQNAFPGPLAEVPPPQEGAIQQEVKSLKQTYTEHSEDMRRIRMVLLNGNSISPEDYDKLELYKNEERKGLYDPNLSEEALEIMRKNAGLELELRTAILNDPEGAITEMNNLGAELIDQGLPDPNKLARLNTYYAL